MTSRRGDTGVRLRTGLALLASASLGIGACESERGGDGAIEERPPSQEDLGRRAGDGVGIPRAAPVLPPERRMRLVRTPTETPPGEWRLPALDYGSTRYSELDQITAANVADLKAITTLSTGIPHGHEGQPLIVGATMYIVTPFPNVLLAIDLTVPGGALKWKYEPHPDPTAFGKACCDVVNRGASYADGKIVYAALDNTVVAVDAETGDQVWRTNVGSVEEGETITMAPLVVKDKVLVGNSGGEMGVRGWLKALDLGSGEVVWTAYSTGPDEETLMTDPGFRPYYAKDRGDDLGATTWPTGQWELGGSTVWGWISYDPGLDLVYYGTGNPGVWNPDLRPGDNKWSLSIIARDPDDGQARWAYQLVPHEAWDYDEIMENILVDMEWEGEMRRLLIHPGRTGFVYVMDRETGELLSAEKFYAHTNWATGYDLETGSPRIVPEKRTHMGQVTRNICPSSVGAKEFVPSAVSPRTGMVYIPTINLCMDYEGVEANYIAGTPYLGASVTMYPGPGDYRGELMAWDPVEATKVWGVRERFPVHSGILATAGDVVFYGTMDGWFKAVDASTGTELWKFKTASGIVGNPVTYLGPDGRQYVAVYSGIGGWLGANAFEWISADDPTAGLGTTGGVADLKKVVAAGSTVYVFGL